MTAYLLRRLGWAVVTLFIFVAVVFIGLQLLLPFDFSTQFAFGGRGDDYYAVRESLGLDRPLLARVGLYVLGLAQGDLGMSYTGEPVAAVIGRSLPFTLLVFAVGGILAYRAGGVAGEGRCLASQPGCRFGRHHGQCLPLHHVPAAARVPDDLLPHHAVLRAAFRPRAPLRQPRSMAEHLSHPAPGAHAGGGSGARGGDRRLRATRICTEVGPPTACGTGSPGDGGRGIDRSRADRRRDRGPRPHVPGHRRGERRARQPLPRHGRLHHPRDSAKWRF